MQYFSKTIIFFFVPSLLLSSVTINRKNMQIWVKMLRCYPALLSVDTVLHPLTSSVPIPNQLISNKHTAVLVICALRWWCKNILTADTVGTPGQRQHRFLHNIALRYNVNIWKYFLKNTAELQELISWWALIIMWSPAVTNTNTSSPLSPHTVCWQRTGLNHRLNSSVSHMVCHEQRDLFFFPLLLLSNLNPSGSYTFSLCLATTFCLSLVLPSSLPSLTRAAGFLFMSGEHQANQLWRLWSSS